MRVLILGGEGMLGHKMVQALSDRLDVFVTSRSIDGLWMQHPIFAGLESAHALSNIDALNLNSVTRVIEQIKPDTIINCIGIIKQRDQAKAAIPSIQVNALFPHQLANLCQSRAIRLIHLSTDCIFSGKRGRYTEEDIPDPIDLYGRTKLLGEVDQPGCLTLRTSIVGWELKHRAGLLEWFATQRGRAIYGYQRAIYTGLSTAVMAELIGELLLAQPDLSGLYQVASSPISKYDLLVCLRDVLGWHDIDIKPDVQFYCDRSLVGTRFETATGWHSPSWEEMIAGLASEWSGYKKWRGLE